MSSRLAKTKNAWPADRPLTNNLVGQRVAAKPPYPGAKVGARVIEVTQSMVGLTLDDVLSGREKQKPLRRPNPVAVR